MFQGMCHVHIKFHGFHEKIPLQGTNRVSERRLHEHEYNTSVYNKSQIYYFSFHETILLIVDLTSQNSENLIPPSRKIKMDRFYIFHGQ